MSLRVSVYIPHFPTTLQNMITLNAGCLKGMETPSFNFFIATLWNMEIPKSLMSVVPTLLNAGCKFALSMGGSQKKIRNEEMIKTWCIVLKIFVR